MKGTPELSAVDALHLISVFLTKEWKSLKPEEISVQTVQSGFNNCVYIVKRTDGKWKKEPKAVIIRKYGGNVVSGTPAKMDLRPCSLTEELLIVQALSHQKLMPKIIGLFDGGRIEEFIDCRPVTADDIANPEILSDLAKNMARVHALEVPMPVPGYKFIDVLRQMWSGYLEENPSNRMEELDFHTELNWLQPLLEPEHHRIVFMNWDPHFENVSIRTNPKEGELKTILFDYEMANYNMRGKDLGLLLLAIQAAREGNTSKSFKFIFPDLEFCRSFLKLYLNECRLLFDDVDDDGVDSMDHMLVESLIGAMVSCLCFYFVHLRSQDAFNSMGSEMMAKFAVMRQGLRDTYFACKNLMQQNFPNHKQILGCAP